MFPNDWLTYNLLQLKGATAPTLKAAIDWVGVPEGAPKCAAFWNMAVDVVAQICIEVSKSKGFYLREVRLFVNNDLDVVLVVDDPSGEAYVFILPQDKVAQACECLVAEKVNSKGGCA